MSHRRAKIVSGGFCAILLRKAQEMFFFFCFFLLRVTIQQQRKIITVRSLFPKKKLPKNAILGQRPTLISICNQFLTNHAGPSQL